MVRSSGSPVQAALLHGPANGDLLVLFDAAGAARETLGTFRVMSPAIDLPAVEAGARAMCAGRTTAQVTRDPFPTDASCLTEWQLLSSCARRVESCRTCDSDSGIQHETIAPNAGDLIAEKWLRSETGRSWAKIPTSCLCGSGDPGGSSLYVGALLILLGAAGGAYGGFFIGVLLAACVVLGLKAVARLFR